jgi:hypothetical protein
MCSGQPRGGQGVGFVHVDQFDAAIREKGTDSHGCGEPEQAARDAVHTDAFLSCAMPQGGMFSGYQFRRVSTFIKTLEEEQRLALATAPFGFEIDDERDQTAPRFLACFSASTNCPSFSNFSHTPRAAICAMRAPRWPSRKPAPRK